MINPRRLWTVNRREQVRSSVFRDGRMVHGNEAGANNRDFR